MQNLDQLLRDNIWIFVPLIIWTLAWKGIALWKSARRSQPVWFVVILILNTVGILEIIYIFAVARKKIPTNTTDSADIDALRKRIV